MIKSKFDTFLTSAEAAKKLGFSADHVRKLFQTGKIKGKKIGRNWIVSLKELAKVKRRRFARKMENTDGADIMCDTEECGESQGTD